MSTTFKLIRERYCGSSSARGLLEQLTPTLLPGSPFVRANRRYPLRAWADGTTACLRHFEWTSAGDEQEVAQVQGEDVRFVRQFAALVVAYPSLPGIGGVDEMDSLEDLMESDARQIRDCLFSSGNLMADLYAVLPVIGTPERSGDVWFQTFAIELQFRKAQTL